MQQRIDKYNSGLKLFVETAFNVFNQTAGLGLEMIDLDRNQLVPLVR